MERGAVHVLVQDLGFVKRGLVGAMLDIGNQADAPESVTVLSSGVAILLAALLTAAALRVPSVAVRLFIILSPAVSLQAGYDLGASIHSTYAVALLIPMSRRRWAVGIAPLMLLVHEAALLTVLPLLGAVHLWRFGFDRALGVCVAISVAVLGAIVSFGSYDGGVPLVEIYPNQPPLALEAVTRSLEENVAFTLLKYGRAGEVFWMLFGGLDAGPGCPGGARRPPSAKGPRSG